MKNLFVCKMIALTLFSTPLAASHHHDEPPCNHESLEEARERAAG